MLTCCFYDNSIREGNRPEPSFFYMYRLHQKPVKELPTVSNDAAPYGVTFIPYFLNILSKTLYCRILGLI